MTKSQKSPEVLPGPLPTRGPHLPNMKRWSVEKLDKELVFARSADDGSVESLAWIAALEKETRCREEGVNL